MVAHNKVSVSYVISRNDIVAMSPRILEEFIFSILTSRMVMYLDSQRIRPPIGGLMDVEVMYDPITNLYKYRMSMIVKEEDYET